MSGFRVTPEQLQSLSGRVNGGASSIESELRGLASSLAPLGSDWAGVAQSRFQQLWADWQKNAQGLHEALTGISQLLNQAGQAYGQAEQQVSQSFSR